MTDQTAYQTIDQPRNTDSRRPTFLTVLCILTFVASAYFLISGIIGLFAEKTFDESQWATLSEEMSKAMDEADPETAKFLENILDATSKTVTAAIQNATTLSLVEILVAIFSALGAYFMFRLRKFGFYIYTGAKAIGVFVPLVLLGVNLLTLLVYGFALFVGIIFIILYAVNLKHMN